MKHTDRATQMTATLIVVLLLTTGCDVINNSSKKEEKKTIAPQKEAIPQVQASNGPLGPDTIVRIGTWFLTTEQFDQRLKLLKEGLPDFDENKPGNKEAVLNELIRQQLLVKDAEDQGIGSQKEIAEAVEDFRRTLLVQDLANRLTKGIVATEKDAKDYYDQNKAMFVDPIEWKVREIVVGDEPAAKDVLVKVLQGGDFVEIAKAQSRGKTAPEGGLLPLFKKAPFEAMQAALANLDAGGTSAVFKGPEGFYVVKVESKRGGEAKSLESVKKDLVSGLTLRKQQEAVLEHINQLAAKMRVEINKELIGSVATK